MTKIDTEYLDRDAIWYSYHGENYCRIIVTSEQVELVTAPSGPVFYAYDDVEEFLEDADELEKVDEPAVKKPLKYFFSVVNAMEENKPVDIDPSYRWAKRRTHEAAEVGVGAI